MIPSFPQYLSHAGPISPMVVVAQERVNAQWALNPFNNPFMGAMSLIWETKSPVRAKKSGFELFGFVENHPQVVFVDIFPVMDIRNLDDGKARKFLGPAW